MGVSLDEVIDIGHGVKATHATLDFLHGLDPKGAWTVIFFKWPDSELARMSPGEAWEVIEAAHRRVCRFHGTNGKCAHTMFEPRVVPCEEAPREECGKVLWGARARRARAALRRHARRASHNRPCVTADRAVFGLPCLQAVGILHAIAIGTIVAAVMLASYLG